MNPNIINIVPERYMPWFEDYAAVHNPCKVYHDGSHFVASRIQPPKPSVERINSRDVRDDVFDALFYQASYHENLHKKDIGPWVYDRMKELCTNEAEIKGDSFDDKEFNDWVSAKLERKYHNIYLKKKRLRRKGFLNPWNYFVTFTYSDELHDEDSFRKKLRKCLSNFHSRRGWRYMGVFERAPDTHRLHFHCLIYVPDGEMVGFISERKDYSTKYKRIQLTHSNSFFAKKFGRNDFEPIDDSNFSISRTVEYIAKYLEKTGENIIYSRGIPSEFCTDLPDHNIAAEMLDFVAKFVIYDDTVDYVQDVLYKGRRVYLDEIMRC